MQQLVSCYKCGHQNDLNSYFCVGCGEKLISNCPYCTAEVNLAFRYCTGCGVDLRVGFVPQKQGEPSERIKTILQDLQLIGEMKNDLPLSEQHWCDALGLRVWRRNLDRYSHGVDGVWIKVGGRFDTKIEAWTDRNKFWDIKKYKRGNWETLIQPTMQITLWLRDHGGVPTEDREDFQKAIQLFRRTGKLHLP